MIIRKFILLVLVLCSLPFVAGAQSAITMPKELGGKSSGNFRNERAGAIALPNETKLPYTDYKQDFGSRAKELAEKMDERSWSSEDTAWEKACEIDTKESYQRYMAMYPNGAHRPQASQKLVDIQVNDIFNSDHGGLPNMKWVSEDEDSPTSTITIENNTGYPLTVMYSGEESKSIVISPGFTGTVTLPNGQYRIAASVPPAHIRPFAGSETFRGGRYEVGFVIVSSGWNPPPYPIW